MQMFKNLTYYLFSISIFINEKLIYFYFIYCFHYNFRFIGQNLLWRVNSSHEKQKGV